MKTKLKDILNENKYQVFLFSCPANFPYFFSSHTWLVVNTKGEISRWETGLLKRKRANSWGHLNRDLNPATLGIDVFPFVLDKLRWGSKLLNFIEGDKNSLASEMTDFILKSPKNYPFKNKYHLLGPNSNTYPQWVIDHFPESGLSLPWNAIGKNYKT